MKPRYPVRLHVMISDAQSAALDRQSQQTGASLAEIVRRLIDKALGKKAA